MKLANGWALEYRQALLDYLRGGDESGLHRAYELGRQAIATKLGILDVVAIQNELAAEFLQEGAPWQREKMSAFFVESLSPFEMTLRGFQEANEKLLRWKHVFEHSGWGIAISSCDGSRLEAMNPAFAMMHGSSSAELIGRPLADLFASGAREDLRGQLQRLQEKGHLSFESVHVRKDGMTFPVLVDATVVRNERSETLYLAINVQDITVRKRNEEALRKAKNAAESANRDLDAFNHSVAHDLRSPLRAINGYSSMLKEDHADHLDGEGLHLLEKVIQSAEAMGRLIGDLLEFSRMGREAMHPARLDMSFLAREVIAELMPVHPNREIDVQIAPLLPGWGDRALLRQVLVNLIGNAIKYTGKKEKATIRIGSTGGTDEDTYWIKDNGAGFDMAYARKLFGVFQRFHSPADFEGTGVGLALVQRIIERHGGRVWADAKVDEGATFFFTLPRKNV